MTDRPDHPHPGFARLLEYWLGETDEAATEAVDLHLLSCEACSAELDELIALTQGVRGAFAEGLVWNFVSPAFVARVASRGVRVREYRIPCGGSINCTVAPEDEFLVSRLEAPLAGVSRVDVAGRLSLFDHEERWQDVPFDAASGELVFAPRLAEVRLQPASVLTLRVLAVEPHGEREIARYTLNHSPWPVRAP